MARILWIMLTNPVRLCTTLAGSESDLKNTTIDQLSLGLDGGAEPWKFSSVALRSRHFRRIHARLQFVREYFPELRGICVRVGLARSRHVLGKGSLDPEEPGIWIRPLLADAFTITHELVHLLQARELVPGGERACDLYALARSPLIIDSAPTYLKVPQQIRDAEVISTPVRNLLHRHARRAVTERRDGRRNYLKFFEKELASEFQRGDFLLQEEIALNLR